MKKKLIAMLLATVVLAGSLIGCGGKTETTEDTSADIGQEVSREETTESQESSPNGAKIALITMDSIDQHWITLNEGAQKAAPSR